MSTFSVYLSSEARKRQARHWLAANPERTDAIAAHCLYHLNRYARHTGFESKGAIYVLKDLMLDYFIDAGYCTREEVHVQTKWCWSCNGTGVHWSGDICWKCGGSGIYARHELAYYVFNIQGRYYAWHQPVGRVQRPIPETETPQEYRADGNGAAISRELAQLYYLVIRQFLLDCGYRGFYDITPTPADVIARVMSPARAWWRARVCSLRSAAREFMDLPITEDEIPF